MTYDDARLLISYIVLVIIMLAPVAITGHEKRFYDFITKSQARFSVFGIAITLIWLYTCWIIPYGNGKIVDWI